MDNTQIPTPRTEELIEHIGKEKYHKLAIIQFLIKEYHQLERELVEANEILNKNWLQCLVRSKMIIGTDGLIYSSQLTQLQQVAEGLAEIVKVELVDGGHTIEQCVAEFGRPCKEHEAITAYTQWKEQNK